MIDIAEMLIRGHNFDVALKEVLDVCPPFKPSPRQTFAAGLAMVAIEHGDSFRLLLRMKHFTSALALVRSQFEAVLRGYWVFFSAEEQWI